MAILLDPYFIGKHVTNTQYINAITFINKLVYSSGMFNINYINIGMCEIALYKSQDDFFSKGFFVGHIKNKSYLSCT